MAWGTPVALGTQTVAAAHLFALAGVSVGAGQLIVITGAIRAHANGDAIIVTDTGANAYTVYTNYSSGSVFGSFIAWAIASTALVAGTITVADTSTATNNFTNGVAAFYSVTGNASGAAEDTPARANQSASSGSPALTSGVPTQAGDLFFYTINEAGWSAYTEASGWTNTENRLSGGASTGLCAGYIIDAGSGAQTHNPTISGSTAFNHSLMAFLVGGAVASSTGSTLAMMGVG